MPVSDATPKCSFCERSKPEVRVLVAGKHAHICDGCVAICSAEAAPLAFCHACTPVDGRHAADCIERDIA